MRPLLKNSVLALAATIATAVLPVAASADWWMEDSGFWREDLGSYPKQAPNQCGWNAFNAPAGGPVFDGPWSGGGLYTGPYRGPFARLAATPAEADCLMKCEQRPNRWGSVQWYTVRICRGHVVSRTRVNVELK